ncbi:MAG TPA: adenylate/guanylate cyclase domain-containing protein [Stellaceae bacterium]|nr:adenylate/guanylate cyclase domain-containing protein [Stellaceae bacterium]
MDATIAASVTGTPFGSGSLAFLFTDIEGSTQRWERLPSAMEAAVAHHDRVLRSLFVASGGHVFKTMGDAFCVAFAGPSAALGAALAAQLTLAEQDFTAVGGIRVRMAVHAGEVQARDGDYFGQALNRTARLLAIAHGGQVLVTGAAAIQVRSALPPDTALIDLGQHRLRDLTHAEQVHQLVAPGLPADFPPLVSLGGVPHNLPEQMTSFVGRERELAEVAAFLEHGRLVTLVGTGGLGKTRLSLQVAAETLERYPDGVWLAELAPLTEPPQVAECVAGLFGLAAAPNRGMTELLTGFLRQRRLLLILDNCEHLVGGAAALASALLPACPQVSILASSREGLGVAGEQTYLLPVLAAPPGSQSPTAEEALQFPAVRLFVERAAAALGRFELTDAEASPVSEICRRLDGIALAIELAAPRLKMLKPAQLLARLDDRFRLLTGGSRTALPRQQTLRALIDWSYNLLNEVERAAMRRLSVFAGSWTLDAATEVIAGDPIEDWEVFDLLASLVEKSLVTTDATGSEIRYRFLESTRAYAAERLAEAGESDWPRRLANHLVAMLRAAEASYETEPTATWLAIHGPEIDNLRGALEWALGPSGDGALGLELLAWSGRLWLELSLRPEMMRLLDRATVHLTADTPPAVAARILGRRARTGGLGRSGLDDVRQGQEFARAAGEPLLLARAQALLASRLLAPATVDEAKTLLEECRAIAAPAGRTKTLASVLNSLGVAGLTAGDNAAARQNFEASLGIARAIGDRQGIYSASQNIAELLFNAGDLDAAIGAGREALAAAEAAGDRQSACPIACNLGAYLLLSGAHEEAELLLASALREAPALGETFVAAWAIQHLALAACKRRALTRAAKLQGYVDQYYAAEQAEREPTERATCDATSAALAALPEPERQRLLAEGSLLTLEQASAIALARGD